MQEFIKKILVFSSPIAAYVLISMFAMPILLSITNGPSTKQQISFQFKNANGQNYSLLILGNSRTYRGINPAYFSFPSFNFSHDNDSFNQIYYKLKHLIENENKIDCLILGLDYFQFSFKSNTRNYAYIDFLGVNYIEDFDNKNWFLLKYNYYKSNINPRRLRSLKPKEHKPFLRENGQYLKHSIASKRDTITRDINRLKFQEKYFKKTLDFCKNQDIQVFIVMLPTRQNELNSYKASELKEFNNFIESFADNMTVHYLNYSEMDGFETSDYTDITHFNERAANRFTRILDADILQIIHNN